MAEIGQDCYTRESTKGDLHYCWPIKCLNLDNVCLERKKLCIAESFLEKDVHWRIQIWGSAKHWRLEGKGFWGGSKTTLVRIPPGSEPGQSSGVWIVLNRLSKMEVSRGWRVIDLGVYVESLLVLGIRFDYVFFPPTQLPHFINMKWNLALFHLFSELELTHWVNWIVLSFKGLNCRNWRTGIVKIGIMHKLVDLNALQLAELWGPHPPVQKQ